MGRLEACESWEKTFPNGFPAGLKHTVPWPDALGAVAPLLLDHYKDDRQAKFKGNGINLTEAAIKCLSPLSDWIEIPAAPFKRDDDFWLYRRGKDAETARNRVQQLAHDMKGRVLNLIINHCHELQIRDLNANK